MDPILLKSLFVKRDDTMLEIMCRINETAQGIALLVDAEERLLDTITDGDLRRAVLAGVDLHKAITELRKEQHRPFTMPEGTPRGELARLMHERKLRHIPLVNDTQSVVDMVQLSDFLVGTAAVGRGVSAVVMAGGLGTRLRPLTNETPKPMLQLGDKPVAEHIIDKLKKNGIRQVYMATHYKAEAYTDHCGDGRAFGMQIDYIHEETPLGTAGVLAVVPKGENPLLVINGDILTELSYEAMLRFHQEYEADMTVGVRQFEFNVPYGVVDMEGMELRQVREKPTERLFVNAGVYLLERAVAQHVPTGCRFDMPQLIEILLSLRKRVIGFPISEYWLDIGRPADYEQARSDVQAGRYAQ